MHTATIKFDVRDAGDGCYILRCNGGLSWEDREMLAASVADHFGDTPALRGLVLDLAVVEHVNSAGLGALFQLVRSLRARDARLTFANVPPALARLFRVVGLDTVGELHVDVDAALADLKQTSASPPPPATRRKLSNAASSEQTAAAH